MDKALVFSNCLIAAASICAQTPSSGAWTKQDSVVRMAETLFDKAMEKSDE